MSDPTKKTMINVKENAIELREANRKKHFHSTTTLEQGSVMFQSHAKSNAAKKERIQPIQWWEKEKKKDLKHIMEGRGEECNETIPGIH